MQADVVSGVEQFHQRTTGHVVELRLSSFTIYPQQQKQHRFDKNVDGVNYLHVCDYSALITDTQDETAVSFAFKPDGRF